MSKIKVGDRVRITNIGKRYRFYTDFIEKHGIQNYLANCIKEGETGIVILAEMNLRYHRLIYALKNEDTGYVMLIGERGVEIWEESE